MVRQITVNGEQIILGGNGALVASRSAPGTWHVVKNGQCDCPGFGYRGHCRHVDAVDAFWRSTRTNADWYFQNVTCLA